MHVWKSLNFIIIINFKKFIFKIFMILPKFNYDFILLKKLFTIKVPYYHVIIIVSHYNFYSF